MILDLRLNAQSDPKRFMIYDLRLNPQADLKEF